MFDYDAARPPAVIPPGPHEIREAERRARVAEHDHAIGELAAHVNAGMSEMLLQLGEFIALEGWGDHYAKSPEEWVAWRLGVTPGDARSYVRIASRLRELPAITEAFSKGELSYWQVRAVITVATPEIEADLLNIARYSTAGQLQRIARAYKGCLDRAELERSNDRHVKRSLRYYFDDDGFLVLRGKLSPEDGRLLVEALHAAEDQLRSELPRDPGSDDHPSADHWSADALVEVARAGLGVIESGSSGTSGSGRVPEVAVHVDVPSLINGSGERCEVAGGPALASETARRITCDAMIQAVYRDGDKVLNLGRRHRTVTPRLRRVLEQRDLTCPFPGCDRRRYRQAHHIEHWIHEGETEPGNLVLLCFHHHRFMHEGGYSVVLHADGSAIFYRPDGAEISATATLGGGSPKELVERHRRQQLRITSDTCTTEWDGTGVDYDACVQSLLHNGMLALPPRGSP